MAEHYQIDVSRYDVIDVYRIIELAGITCPVAQHVLKKAFAAGQRGHKSVERDWQDIKASAERKIEMMREDAPAPLMDGVPYGGAIMRCPDCIAEHCACMAR